jgi:hypothetical protein
MKVKINLFTFEYIKLNRNAHKTNLRILQFNPYKSA